MLAVVALLQNGVEHAIRATPLSVCACMKKSSQATSFLTGKQTIQFNEWHCENKL